jgi:hypothetical protein
MHTIAFPFEDGSIGMVCEAIKQSSDASGVGENLVPFFKSSVGSDHLQRSAKMTRLRSFEVTHAGSKI